jgi:hypothetical protein
MDSKVEESCLEFQHDWKTLLVSAAQIPSYLMIIGGGGGHIARSVKLPKIGLRHCQQYGKMIHFEEKVQIFELNILMEVLDKTAKKI